MLVELEKEDLVNLVMSQIPYEEDRLKFTNSGLGEWSFRHARWDWNINTLFKMSEETLLDLYSYLRGTLYTYLKE